LEILVENLERYCEESMAISLKYELEETTIENMEVAAAIKKDRREYFKKYNDMRKETLAARYRSKIETKLKNESEKKAKYYGAEAIKVLMTFKEYTELNCQKSFKDGFADIVAIMKLEQIADTAKNEEKQRTNVENGYIDEVERLERQGDSYLKEIEAQKYHEERGKINLEVEREKIIDDYEAEQKKSGNQVNIMVKGSKKQELLIKIEYYSKLLAEHYLKLERLKTENKETSLLLKCIKGTKKEIRISVNRLISLKEEET
ncbi:5310_t:CDS:2, partial [Gigaspora margarita]